LIQNTQVSFLCGVERTPGSVETENGYIQTISLGTVAMLDYTLSLQQFTEKPNICNLNKPIKKLKNEQKSVSL
jgi:hypothetical protein